PCADGCRQAVHTSDRCEARHASGIDTHADTDARGIARAGGKASPCARGHPRTDRTDRGRAAGSGLQGASRAGGSR
ncbi:MAG: hypothetical protein ACREN5_06260, partial [Gemmatimonadales bacterium]